MSQASFDAADQYSDKACGSEFIKIINELIVAQPNDCASSHG
jgi:hypothetical protein